MPVSVGLLAQLCQRLTASEDYAVILICSLHCSLLFTIMLMRKTISELNDSVQILEVEMRSGKLEKRIQAFHKFRRLADTVSQLRLTSDLKFKESEFLLDLDRKILSIEKRQPYRIVEWINSSRVKWFICVQNGCIRAC